MKFQIKSSLWHDWFAWYPVVIEGTICWLEVVKRRWNVSDWEYQKITEDS